MCQWRGRAGVLPVDTASAWVSGIFAVLTSGHWHTHTKARLVTYPVRGLHYGPTLKVVTLDLQEPLPKYILVLTLEYHDSAGRRHGPAIA